MKSQFYANGELNDSKIIEALNEAKEMYENGELVEVKDLLVGIVSAIDQLEKHYEIEESAFPEAKQMAEIAEKSSEPTRALIRSAMASTLMKEILEAAEDGKNYISWGYEDWRLSAPDLAGVDESLEQEVFDEIIDEIQEKGYFIDAHLGTMKICW